MWKTVARMIAKNSGRTLTWVIGAILFEFFSAFRDGIAEARRERKNDRRNDRN